MRTITTAVLALTLTTAAFGQWDQIQRLPNQSQDSDHGGSPLYQGGGDVAFAANGDILVFYTENGAFTNVPNGTPARILMARSTDNGATWNEPVTIREAGDNGVQDFGPALVAVSPVSGRITMVHFNLAGSAPSFQLSDETWHSDDNGETWTLAGSLTDFADFEGRLEYTPTGVLVYSYGRSSGGDKLAFRTSTDDGATWSDEAQIASPSNTLICDHTLTTFTNTEWLVAWSDCFFGPGGMTTLTQLQTGDGGTTWSDPAEILTRASGGLSGVDLLSSFDDTLWLTYKDGSSIYYRTSEDEGVTWTDPEQWTHGTNDGLPECVDAVGILDKRGQVGTAPLCVFLAIERAEDENLPEIFAGRPGFSEDPLLTVSTEDVGYGIRIIFTLSQNYPNPFNPSTTIPFELDRPQYIHMTLHDALGREVRTLASGVKAAGRYDVTVDASGLPSGVYVYWLQTEDGVASRVMTVGK